MIEENYIDFELEQLLKEKGFDIDECEIHLDPTDSTQYDITYQMVRKWLREKKGIDIVVFPYNDGYGAEIYRDKHILKSPLGFEKYEYAEKACIKECCETLI